MALAAAATLGVRALDLDFVYEEGLWQVLPAVWLLGAPLLDVLVALHAQPPALTAVQWLDVNLLPRGTMEASGLLAYATLVAATGLAARALTGRGWAGAAGAAAAAASPSAILYGRFWFSTIFCAALVAVFAALVAAGSRRRSALLLAASGLPIGLAALFHSAFTIVVAILAAAALPVALAAARTRRERIGVVALLSLALALGLATPAKNRAVFGLFAPSSWGPVNVATALSGWSAWDDCKAEILRQPPPGPAERSGVAAMTRAPTKPDGGLNFNHVAMLECARRVDLAAHLARGDWPANLAHNAYFALANASWDYAFLSASNLRAVEPLIAVVDPLRPGGRPSFDYAQGQTRAQLYWSRLSPATLLLTSLSLAAAATYLTSIALTLLGRGNVAALSPAPALFAVVYLSYLLVCLVANGVEMNRLRFAVFPLELGLLLAAVLSMAGRRLNHPPPTPPPAPA